MFRIALDSSLSLATSAAGQLYTQPNVYPLAASPVDHLGAPPPPSPHPLHRLRNCNTRRKACCTPPYFPCSTTPASTS